MAISPILELAWGPASPVSGWSTGEALERQAQLGAHHEIAVAGRWQVGVII